MNTRAVLPGILALSAIGTAAWIAWPGGHQDPKHAEERGTLVTAAEEPVDTDLGPGVEMQRMVQDLDSLRRDLARLKADLGRKADAGRTRNEMDRALEEIESLRIELVDSQGEPLEPVNEPALDETVPTDPSSITVRHEDAFADQVVDAAWSEEEEIALFDFFDDEPVAGLSLNHLECRTSTCRIELEVDSEGARDAFLDAVGMPPFDKGGFHYTTEDQRGFIVFTNRGEGPRADR